MKVEAVDVTVWRVALTFAEIAQLAAGVSPWLIRPDAIVSSEAAR